MSARPTPERLVIGGFVIAFFAGAACFLASFYILFTIGLGMGYEELHLFEPTSYPMSAWEKIALGGASGLSALVFWLVFRFWLIFRVGKRTPQPK